MSDPTIPLTVIKAAKRGFIRTASQSIATSLGTGITVGALATIINGGNPDWWTIGIGAAVFIATPIVNGAQSYFSILARGVPTDYLAADPLVTTSELPADIQSRFDAADEFAAQIKAGE